MLTESASLYYNVVQNLTLFSNIRTVPVPIYRYRYSLGTDTAWVPIQLGRRVVQAAMGILEISTFIQVQLQLSASPVPTQR
jgi:hypothetical protein